MRKMKRLCLFVMTMLLLLSCFAACDRRQEPESTLQPTVPAAAEPNTYTVQLSTDKGYPLEGIGVYIYTDETQQELVWFARTDAEGKITFRDVTWEGYIAVLSGVSADYIVQEQYTLSGDTTVITVEAQMQSGVDLSAVTRGLGDVMFDFTLTACDGTAYTLTELLENKDAVVLNFWYLNCDPCRQEFPYLQAAYEQYSDRIEILAMNPVDGTDEEISAYANKLGLTFPMFSCDPAWASAMKLTAYPTTVIIDRFGMISLVHTGSVPATKVFADAFAHFTAEDYVQGIVEHIEDLETEVPGSNPDEPIELGGVTGFEAVVPAGMKIYYHLYRVNGYLSVKNADIYAVYNGRTYGPQAGGIGFTVKSPDTYTPAVLTLGNAGDEDLTLNISIAKPGGQFDNPYPASLGEFSTKVSAGNNQGVYYQYKATEEGYLTVACMECTAGVKYDYSLYNLNSGKLNTIEADGNAEGTMVSVKVQKGESVKIQITTKPDNSGNYPAANFKSNLFMSDTPVTEETELEPKIDYAVTVTDELRKPIANVYLNIDTGENKPLAVKTDEKGVAHVQLEAGTYPVVLTVPDGYKAATTEFYLTENRPIVSLKLDTYVVRTLIYTVTVTDAEGTPLEGVSVMIGSMAALTDAAGKAEFSLPEGSYIAIVSLADGTLLTQTFPEGETDITLAPAPVIPEETEPEETEPGETEPEETEPEEKILYTLTLTDYSGKAQSGVTVQFLGGGIPVAVQQSDEAGRVSAELPEGDYKVQLAFAGNRMYYEDATAVLTPARPALTIRVTAVTGGQPEEEWFGPTYTVGVGGTYVMMQPNVVTYFAFAPTQEGLYRISISDPAGQISYWSSINYPVRQEINGGEPTDTFELNVKETNIGNTYAIGVTGVQDGILEIERTGAAVLDDTDIPWQSYEGTPPTESYTLTGSKKLTYVDLTSKTDAVVPVLGSDGYYHLNTADGPLLLVNLGPNAPYISMYNMLGVSGVGGTKLGRTFYNEDGSVLKKEDYTNCMIAYVEKRDPVNQVYPLTEDLMYMLQNGGGSMGWWDAENANFQFAEMGDSFNPELGWMFAVCYQS